LEAKKTLFRFKKKFCIAEELFSENLLFALIDAWGISFSGCELFGLTKPLGLVLRVRPE